MVHFSRFSYAFLSQVFLMWPTGNAYGGITPVAGEMIPWCLTESFWTRAASAGTSGTRQDERGALGRELPRTPVLAEATTGITGAALAVFLWRLWQESLHHHERNICGGNDPVWPCQEPLGGFKTGAVTTQSCGTIAGFEVAAGPFNMGPGKLWKGILSSNLCGVCKSDLSDLRRSWHSHWFLERPWQDLWDQAACGRSLWSSMLMSRWNTPREQHTAEVSITCYVLYMQYAYHNPRFNGDCTKHWSPTGGDDSMSETAPSNTMRRYIVS